MPDDKSYKRKSVEIEDEIIIEEELEPEAQTVTLVLLKDVKLTIIGKATGSMYVFNGAGSIVDVDEQDAEYLLNRIAGESCCGSRGSPYFEVVR